MARARALKYRIYLYFIATEDPLINVSRVENRVSQGGHDVPTEKIVSRYYRSLELLWPALALTNRAYIFDNSGHEQEKTWLAEVTDGTGLTVKSAQVPQWFRKAVLDKIPG